MAKDGITFVKPNIWSAPEVTRVANARIRPTSGSPHDRTPPTIPTGFTAVAVSETQVDMTWNASTDPAVPGYETSGMKGYRIFRNSQKIAEVGASVLSYSATGLTPGAIYQFRVAALDNRNNQSPQTPQITVTMDEIIVIPDEPDTTPPSVPAGLSATVQSTSQINLAWSASTDPTVAGQETSGVANYKLYRDSAHLVTLGLVLTYEDTGLTVDTEYSYTVSAMDVAGNESAQSAAQLATTNANTYSLNVAWTPATQNDDGSAIGTILSHNIYASLTAGEPYEVVQNVPWTGTASAVLDLPSSGVWYVVVKTVTALGESVASEEESRAANVS
jgi:chitodextrinase